MPLPSQYNTAFHVQKAGTSSGTVEIVATPTNGEQYYVTGITVCVKVVGAAGTTIHFRSKAASGQSSIMLSDASVAGQYSVWFGEHGIKLPKNHGIEMINPASATSEVTVTGH